MNKDTDKLDILNFSKDGLIKNFGIEEGKYLYWTDSTNVELPIVIREGDTVEPRTIPEVMYDISSRKPDSTAMKIKRKKFLNDPKLYYVKWTWK